MVLGAMVSHRVLSCPVGGVGVSTLVIGMPHRGRLNLLMGPLQYPAEALLHKVPQGGGGGRGEEGGGEGEGSGHCACRACVVQLSGKSEHADGLPSAGDVLSHLCMYVYVRVCVCVCVRV